MLTVKWSSCLKSADWSFNIRNTRNCVSLHNIYPITTSDLKTIWQYIVLPSCLTQDAATLTGCESTTCLRSPPRATSCIITFPRTLLFRRTTNSGLFVQSGRAECWYKLTESFSCSASGWKFQNHSAGIPHFPAPTPTSLHCVLCVSAHYEPVSGSHAVTLLS